MIDKPSILISSTGRTGTEFFAKLFADIVPDSTSLHEPDIFKFVGVENRVAHYSQQLRRTGIWRMVFLKALGKWTLVNLSDARLRGALDDGQAAKQLLNQRHDFVARMPGSLYVESNLGYYGLLDVLPEVFRFHKAIYIVRDGRAWVRSMMNWGEVYGKTGLRQWFAHKWPAASDVPGDPLSATWRSLPRFEQLCWAWVRLNEVALDHMAKNPCARLFHFERIFAGEERYSYLNDLVSFATALPGIDAARIRSTDGWLERKIHESAGKFPGWADWSPDQKRRFEQMCGPLMERLGYAL